jgi:small subunit ribosomal protein S13e
MKELPLQRAPNCETVMTVLSKWAVSIRSGRKSPRQPFQIVIQTVQLIVDFAKKNIRPSQIDALLRDRHGIEGFQDVIGNIVLRVLKADNAASGIPEKLYSLIKKATKVRKYPERSGHGIDAKYRLLLIGSRIHHLTGYCKVRRIIPLNWKYSSRTVPALTA